MAEVPRSLRINRVPGVKHAVAFTNHWEHLTHAMYRDQLESLCGQRYTVGASPHYENDDVPITCLRCFAARTKGF